MQQKYSVCEDRENSINFFFLSPVAHDEPSVVRIFDLMPALTTVALAKVVAFLIFSLDIYETF